MEGFSDLMMQGKYDPDSVGILDEGCGIDNETKSWQLQMEGIRTPSGKRSLLFFRPDREFIQWLKEYANGRVIIDVGCGSGWLTEQLNDIGCNAIGIDPYYDEDDYMCMNRERIENQKNIIHIMIKPIEECKSLIKALGNRSLMLFARPCHSGFVETALDMRPVGMEALYITLPNNLKKYNDLGDWESKASIIPHKGWSADGEIVMSIK